MSLQERVAKIRFNEDASDDGILAQMHLFTSDDVCLGAVYYCTKPDGMEVERYEPAHLAEDIAKFIREMTGKHLMALFQKGQDVAVAVSAIH